MFFAILSFYYICWAFPIFFCTRKRAPTSSVSALLSLSWQRPTLPREKPLSTIGDRGLNFCVRYGYRCDPASFITRIVFLWVRFPLSQNYTVLSLLWHNFFPYLLPALFFLSLFGQALDLLVSVSSMDRSTYTSDLSTRSSLWSLTSFRNGKSHLKVCFALRCFQRLSPPDLATQLGLWRDNWFTSGLSNPVLSY